jgi:hypothetical protein
MINKLYILKQILILEYDAEVEKALANNSFSDFTSIEVIATFLSFIT